MMTPQTRMNLHDHAFAVVQGDHMQPVKNWASVAIDLIQDINELEARLDECRKAREGGY